MSQTRCRYKSHLFMTAVKLETLKKFRLLIEEKKQLKSGYFQRFSPSCGQDPK